MTSRLAKRHPLFGGLNVSVQVAPPSTLLNSSLSTAAHALYRTVPAYSTFGLEKSMRRDRRRAGPAPKGGGGTGGEKEGTGSWKAASLVQFSPRSMLLKRPSRPPV